MIFNLFGQFLAIKNFNLKFEIDSDHFLSNRKFHFKIFNFRILLLN